TVLMTSVKNVTATFAINTYALNVTTVGSGSVVKAPNQAQYNHGTAVKLTATPVAGWHFVGYTGDVTASTDTVTVVMTSVKNVTATFAINTYALNVTTVGSGSVVKAHNLGQYNHGTAVKLTATPVAGWHFVGYTGDVTASTDTVTVVMTSVKNVTATFAINTYALNVTTVGSGSVVKAPNQAQYDHGTAVKLTATPAAGWHFMGYTGDVTASTDTVTVVMTSVKNVT